jgi:hypothetical protein
MRFHPLFSYLEHSSLTPKKTIHSGIDDEEPHLEMNRIISLSLFLGWRRRSSGKKNALHFRRCPSKNPRPQGI